MIHKQFLTYIFTIFAHLLYPFIVIVVGMVTLIKLGHRPDLLNTDTYYVPLPYIYLT